ncbi:MAG: bifunctional methionine sulfoxide reductase B/A protein [Phycisphaeraceae bacterium]|nr:bifunctional methionine sulfoxide reductase B/A protein [Phycisphaerales bacterium]MCB9859389.1 bifunctional methionine sulfoxide reductase B/A protein [Phycisphaeraceae bacterium]
MKSHITTTLAGITALGMAGILAFAGLGLPTGEQRIDQTPQRVLLDMLQPEQQPSPHDPLHAQPDQTMTTTSETSTQRRIVSRSAYNITPLSKDRVAELASVLDEETYRITQNAGTEAAFCGNLLDNHKDGTYVCVVCGLPLFSSEHKFTSGTGWPSFDREFDPQHVAKKVDTSYGMTRVEINCARCGSHLGHAFPDGPTETGVRHCLNSASLTFIEKGEEFPDRSKPIPTETAYFAGGCFWGIEHFFQAGPGVISAESGYMQGKTEAPSYKDVCYTNTGHAETVKVVYDPTQITYARLLQAFFTMHDPTTLNRQGPDVGEQYRSGIWYVNDQQRDAAKEFVKILNESGVLRNPIVTQIEKAETFWPAEEYHQDYIAKTGRACHIADPWTADEKARAAR